MLFLGLASSHPTIGAIYLWSYVYNLVRMFASKDPKEVEIYNSSIGNDTIGQSIVDTKNCKAPLLPTKECKIPVDQQAIKPPCIEPETSEQMGSLDKLKQQLRKVFRRKNLKILFAPSTTGAIAGFAVGLVPVVRNLLIGESAPLHVIQDSALLLGDGSIPSVTLVMGGNLLKGLRRSEIQKSLVISIILARYLALPIIGTVIVKGAIHFALVPKDPLYQFVLLLQFAVPPAMNIATMTQLFGAGENECSIIMLWTYVLASIALTFWSTFFMWLVT